MHFELIYVSNCVSKIHLCLCYLWNHLLLPVLVLLLYWYCCCWFVKIQPWKLEISYMFFNVQTCILHDSFFRWGLWLYASFICHKNSRPPSWLIQVTIDRHAHFYIKNQSTVEVDIRNKNCQMSNFHEPYYMVHLQIPM